MSKLCQSNEILKVRLIISIYVDDFIYIGDERRALFKKSMMQDFDMVDLRFFTGIEVLRKPEGIFMCKKKVCH